MVLHQIFWYWLNFNILVSSTGIITLQKSSFPLIFLCDSNFFCSKGMKTIQTVKITIIFWRNSSLYCWWFFYCTIMPLPSTLALRFSPFKIIRRITCFSRSELCFETWVGYVFSFLAYKTLRALSFSIFFQSSLSVRKFFPRQLY